MPPKKLTSSSPYFKSPPIRKSTRVSTASSSSAKKRAKPLSSESESEFDDGDDSSSSNFKAKARGNKRVKVDQDYESASESKDEEEDEDHDSSDDEAKPPKTTIIPLPKLRDEGSVVYEEARIHENTLLFLKDLKKHNNREWMRVNDGEFRRAQKDFESFIGELSSLVVEKDATIPELPSKDIIFRIYRDVRFSKDPTPYKPHFSAAWSRTGKKGPYAAYYLHLEPNNKSFVGGGLWQPEGPSLELLRDDIDQNPQGLKQVLTNNNLRRDYFPSVKGKSEMDVVAAFCEKNKDGALKTKPRGYETTHQDIKLLRLRSFTIGHQILDSALTNEDSIRHVAGLIGSMVPFITYLNSVVRPDRRRNNNVNINPNNNPNPALVTASTAANVVANSSNEDDEDDEDDAQEDGNEE